MKKSKSFNDKTNSKEKIFKEHIMKIESLLKTEKENNVKLNKENEEIEKNLFKTQTELNNLKKDYDTLLNEKFTLNEKFADATLKNNELNLKYSMLKFSCKNLKKENISLKNKEKEILTSTSWKITSPLRKISKTDKKY